jgi:hypothetical protein
MFSFAWILNLTDCDISDTWTWVNQTLLAADVAS